MHTEIESARGREVEQTVGKRSGVEGDREGSLVLVHNGTERGQGKVEVGDMVGAPCCMVATHRPRAGLSRILPNRCRVMVWMLWDAILGQLRAKLELGPKMKFVVLVLLYIFRLRVMAIRVVD